MSTLEWFAKDFADRHPRHTDHDSWDQDCQALMFQFNGMERSYNSARDAFRASGDISTKAGEAPTGAFHFWEVGVSWHVGQGLTPGGRFVFMATRTARSDIWAPFLGVMSVKAYPGIYRGWSLKDGDQPSRAADDLGRVRTPRERPAVLATAPNDTAPNDTAPNDHGPKKIRRIARYLNARHLGLQTAASQTGHRMDPGAASSNYWRLIQLAGRADGRYGAGFVITGIPGPRSHALEDHYATVAPA